MREAETKVLIGCFVVMAVTACCVPLLVLTSILGNGNSESYWMRQLHSQDFQELHGKVIQLETITNLAILPRQHIIVSDGRVVDLQNSTYGKEPEFTMYQEYYEAVQKNTYHSLATLLTQMDLRITADDLDFVLVRMKQLGISDVSRNSWGIVYTWDASAMWGSNGIIYSQRDLEEFFAESGPDTLEKIEHDFYYYLDD